MHRPTLLLLVSAALCFAAPRQLTIEDAVALALKSSPVLVNADAGIRYADARVREVTGQFLPAVKLNAGYTRLSEVDPFAITLPLPSGPVTETLAPAILNNYSARLSVQQPVFTGFKLFRARSIARDYARAVRLDADRDRAGLIHNVRSAYWNLVKTREMEQVVERSIAQVEAHVRDVENLLAQGLALRNDLLKVRVQRENVRLMAVDAAGAVRVARTALNSLTELPLETEIDPVSRPDSQPELPDTAAQALDELLAEAGRSRPELRAVEARVRAAGDNVRVAQSGWYPQVALFGNYYYSRPNQRIQPGRDEFRSTWDVGLGATFDVWNWGVTLNQTRQARAQQTQLQANLSQLRDAITLEVTQDFLGLVHAVEKVRAAGVARDQAEENFRVVSAGFKAGTILSSELLDAEVSLLQARLSHTTALVDCELSRARLDRTLGRTQ